LRSGLSEALDVAAGEPAGFQGDGASPTLALLDRPYGVETDTAVRLFIADTYNQRIRVVMMR
jgi:hypothetical protein